jgi:hypothetical protein
MAIYNSSAALVRATLNGGFALNSSIELAIGTSNEKK